MRSSLRMQNACGPCLCMQNACGPCSACKTHAVHAPHEKCMQSMYPHAKRMRYIFRMQNACGPLSVCKTHAVHASACKTHAVHASACKTHASHALLLNDRSEKLSEVPQTVLELLETSRMCFRSVTHDLVCKINAIIPPHAKRMRSIPLHAKRMRSILRMPNACSPCLRMQNACGTFSACKTH